MAFRKISLFLATAAIPALLASALPVAALAADAGGQSPAEVGEVIVTAQRREQKLIDVPVAVTAVSGTALKNIGVTQATDLVAIVPGLQFVDAGPVPKLSLRGISLNDFGDSNESPIAFYTDDVYLASPAAPLGQLFDISRVEVLRGPQGTLFGRNASGGLVQVISNKPGRTFGGDFSLQYGSYNQVIAEGAVNIPITDAIRTRTSFDYDRDDGWQKDVVTGTRTGKTNSIAVREIVDMDLAPNLTNEFIARYGRSDNVDPAVGFRGLYSPIDGSPCSLSAVFANQCVTASGQRNPNPNPTTIYSEVRNPPTIIETVGFSDTLHYTGRWFNLTSVSAYYNTDKDHVFDEGGSGDPLAGLTIYTANRRQVSQEFRFDGEVGGLKWVAGAFYFHEDVTNGEVTIPELVALIGPDGVQTQFNQRTDSYAGFGQLEYAVTPTVSLIGGVRYTTENKSLNISDDFAHPDFLNHEVANTDKVTYRGGLDWKFAHDWMAYATVSTGFKSPAFDTSFVVSGGATPSKPEENTSYEIGVKGEAADRRIQITAAAFYEDYRDFQLIAVPPGSALAETVLANAKQATIYGIEGEVNVRPIDGLSIDLSATGLHTQINSPGLLIGGGPVSGDPLIMSPSFTMKGLVQYDWKIAGVGTISPRIDGSYRTESYDSLPAGQLDRIPAYPLVNAGISWTPEKAPFKIDFLVENLTDQAYYTFTDSYVGVDVINWGKVRTFAARISTSW